MLQPGQSSAVTVSLSPRDLSVWDVGTHSWAPVKGEFTFEVGASSADIRATASLVV